ncbi:MAG: glycoside hydrolase family 3 N-terminal domain-containing protein [Longimicrobiales bacterium]
MVAIGVALPSCARPRPESALPAGARREIQNSSATASEWASETFARMSLEEKIGQMIMVRIEGGFSNSHGSEMTAARSLINRIAVGGFAVGLGTPLDMASKLNELQAESKIPLLFGADLEFGAGMRMWPPTYLPYGIDGDGGTVFPYNMGIAATGDPEIAALEGRITAREARAVGIRWLFAPVTDVNTLPANPIVNIRSYSHDPATVGRFASAFIRGAESGGVLTTAKHFPGHGSTALDSHISLPVLSADAGQLRTTELPPFQSVISAGVSSIMTGHLAVPALTGGSNTPASLARDIGTLLRGQMEFKGLIITDALTMGALREIPGYSPGELAVRAVEGGADVVLSPPDPIAAHAALLAAVRGGRIRYQRIDDAVRRILAAKGRLGLHAQRTVPLDSVAEIVGSPEHAAVAEDIAMRAITLARDAAGVLPLDPRTNRNIAVISFTRPTDITAGAAFVAELRRIYGSGVEYMRLDVNTDQGAYDAAVAAAAAADATIFAAFVMPVSGAGAIALPERGRILAERLATVAKKGLVVSFGDPYSPSTLSMSTTYLLAWQPRGRYSQIAAAHAIAGVDPITARLPITLAGASLGTGVQRTALDLELKHARADDVGMRRAALDSIDDIILERLRLGAAPGAAIAVGRHGRIVKLRGYGTIDRKPGFGAVTDSTLYDLASLTKVIGTTTALMMLVDQGILHLDTPVMQYIPEWRGTPAKEAVTLRNLVLHNSGLAAYGPLYTDTKGREQYRRRIAAMDLTYAPGTKTVYSDFGVILLGMVIEQVTGGPLDRFLHDRLFGPLGMRDTGFNPLQWPFGGSVSIITHDTTADLPDPPFLKNRIAPTEVGAKGQIWGTVHDENAAAIGGVSGHAGLFSSARDLAVFAQLLLNHGYYGGRRYIDPATIDSFTHRFSSASSRALGWDTPTPNSSAGDYFTESSYGHTGFTGTSIWIDPERDVFVVLLTNRVNPTRENQQHLALRRAVADQVQKAIVDMTVEKRVDPPRRP